MRLETLNVRIPHTPKRDLWRQAAQLEVTPSHLVRCLLAAGAARFQPAELNLDLDVERAATSEREAPR